MCKFDKKLNNNKKMTIGILGAGSMGIGIAQIASTFKHKTLIFDTNKDSINKSLKGLEQLFDKLTKKGKFTEQESKEILSRIIAVSDINELSNCDIVIEAIIEDLEIKKNVFKQLDKICKPSCILATNTSSLSVSAIAGACSIPERVIGIHFFNPAPLMPLVEIIPAIQTNEKTIEDSKKLIDSWGKRTVVAKDTPGFIVNRVARPFYGEALRIYEEGIADFATIDWALKELGGFKMGPFTLMDFIGNDVNYAVTESVFKAFYYDPRYKPSFTQKRHAEAGWLGRKTQRGYYDYAEGVELPLPNKDKKLGEEIVWRVLVMLINEAADALFLNIANRDDIDTAMTKGVNYPKGLLKWADEIGIDKCVNKLDELHDTYREDRYRCSLQLRRMVMKGKTFY